MIAVGSKAPEQWHVKTKDMDFFDLKGEVETLLDAAHVSAEYQRSERAWLHPGQSAEIVVNGQSVGYLGRLHPSLEAELDLGVTWVAEIDQSVLLQPYVYNFTELSRFPSVRRDIALVIDANIALSSIETTIKQSAGEFLSASWLFDVYTGQGVETGHRSLAFALLFQHPSRTLEDAEIKQAMDRVIESLETTYKAKLRAS